MICIKCGVSIKDGAKFCSSCGHVSDLKISPPVSAPLDASHEWSHHAVVARPDDLSKAVTNRYKDAYKVSKAVVAIGKFIKVVGAILGAIVGFISLLVGGAMSQLGGMSGRNDGVAFIALVVGALYGGIVFLIFYVVGVIVSAQGQILKASLDNSVHSSPFVNNDEKARIMSLI